MTNVNCGSEASALAAASAASSASAAACCLRTVNDVSVVIDQFMRSLRDRRHVDTM